MNDTATADGVEVFGLVDSMDQEKWIKLLHDAMRDVGPAAQTLGGLLALTKRETFSPVAMIAQRARVPMTTAKKHISTLHEHGWVENTGRQRTRNGALRRTATVKITRQTHDRLKAAGYGVLPWWASGSIRRFGKFPWSARAVLSVVMARLMALKAAAVAGDECGLDAGDIAGSIENMGGDERFAWSLSRLQYETGLHRESIVVAKRILHRAKIVKWFGDGTVTDVLAPNWEFQIVTTPASAGRVFLDFRG